jgi:enamine deaminase RidA (YjgF/YER057c/UK114 family)
MAIAFAGAARTIQWSGGDASPMSASHRTVSATATAWTFASAPARLHLKTKGALMSGDIKFLNPDSLTKPPGYSQVVEVMGPGRTVYVAGQFGQLADGSMAGAPGDFRAQAVQAFENIKTALAAVGGRLEHVVKVNNYLTDIADLKTFREVRAAYFPAPATPASTTIAISRLARDDAVFEVDAVAALPPK